MQSICPHCLIPQSAAVLKVAVVLVPITPDLTCLVFQKLVMNQTLVDECGGTLGFVAERLVAQHTLAKEKMSRVSKEQRRAGWCYPKLFLADLIGPRI